MIYKQENFDCTNHLTNQIYCALTGNRSTTELGRWHFAANESLDHFAKIHVVRWCFYATLQKICKKKLMDRVHMGYIFEWMAIFLSCMDCQSSYTMCGYITASGIKLPLLAYLSKYLSISQMISDPSSGQQHPHPTPTCNLTCFHGFA